MLSNIQYRCGINISPRVRFTNETCYVPTQTFPETTISEKSYIFSAAKKHHSILCWVVYSTFQSLQKKIYWYQHSLWKPTNGISSCPGQREKNNSYKEVCVWRLVSNVCFNKFYTYSTYMQFIPTLFFLLLKGDPLHDFCDALVIFSISSEMWFKLFIIW